MSSISKAERAEDLVIIHLFTGMVQSPVLKGITAISIHFSGPMISPGENNVTASSISFGPISCGGVGVRGGHALHEDAGDSGIVRSPRHPR